MSFTVALPPRTQLYFRSAVMNTHTNCYITVTETSGSSGGGEKNLMMTGPASRYQIPKTVSACNYRTQTGTRDYKVHMMDMRKILHPF